MLQLKNIVKDYGEGDSKVQALKGVSINFRANEFVSILGHSGCGKTTLLNIVGGLDQYTDGDLIIKGKTTKKYKDKDWDTYRNHSVGFVFQSYCRVSRRASADAGRRKCSRRLDSVARSIKSQIRCPVDRCSVWQSRVH